MGGVGSGVWQRSNSKVTVEELFALDVNKLARSGVLCAGAKGELRWHHAGRRVASVGFQVSRDSLGRHSLRISYRWNDTLQVNTTIPLESTVPHFSGRRWWMTCPMSPDDVSCGKRVAKLFLHKGQFGCRSCHDLTYRSCQESHQQKRLFNRCTQLAGFDM